MIVAQLDNINCHYILDSYSKKVLQGLESVLMKNAPKYWWTIYLCMFTLLSEASWITQDRHRHAKDNYGKKVSFFPSAMPMLESDQEM